MGIRSEVALAVSKSVIDSLDSEFIREFLESADDIQTKKGEYVDEFNLYVWDWIKWYDTDEAIIEIMEWLEKLPRRYDFDDLELCDNKSYQLIVFTPECDEHIDIGSYSYGLSVGIKSAF